ncbi:large ribosomal subunit protein mL42-like isoform X1 [Asterias amurensis]|uniref:large ribosomal subunit protein mL42-like isoform X1 n=1 Tax=Asterias amurensis TaxID=7602 RepID=UPI003AB82E2A
MAAHMARLSKNCLSFFNLYRLGTGSKHLLGPSAETLLCRCFSSTQFIQTDGSHAIVETADGDTIVCYHPSEPFPYEHTKPILRPDPSKPEETTDSILKMKMTQEQWSKDKKGPNYNELAKMFYTTKHRWYPLGIRRRMKVNRNPPRDRPYL